MAKNVTTMVERLRDHGILGDVRQRMGAENDNDDLFDSEINEMTPDQVMYEWVGWKLGYGSWWYKFKEAYDRISKDA
jgi:hypothetical protein